MSNSEYLIFTTYLRCSFQKLFRQLISAVMCPSVPILHSCWALISHHRLAELLLLYTQMENSLWGAVFVFPWNITVMLLIRLLAVPLAHTYNMSLVNWPTPSNFGTEHTLFESESHIIIALVLQTAPSNLPHFPCSCSTECSWKY